MSSVTLDLKYRYKKCLPGVSSYLSTWMWRGGIYKQRPKLAG